MALIDPADRSPYKHHLGDSVYVDWNGFHIVLTTEDDGRASNEIALNPDVFRSLIDYTQDLTKLLEHRELQRRERTP